MIIAAASATLLTMGEGAGWLPHGLRPAQWSTGAWLALFLAGWALMTGAMMLPSSLPFLQSVHRVGGRSACTAACAAFTAVWLAVGILQWTALWVSGDWLARLAPGRPEQLASASLMAAAIYQARPLASACQRACARPFGILARHLHGRRTRRDAFAAGLHYRATCVGCCLPMIV